MISNVQHCLLIFFKPLDAIVSIGVPVIEFVLLCFSNKEDISFDSRKCNDTLYLMLLLKSSPKNLVISIYLRKSFPELLHLIHTKRNVQRGLGPKFLNSFLTFWG